MSAPINMLALNRECSCFPIAREQVEQSILSLLDSSKIANSSQVKQLLSDRAHYFASTPVFISPHNIKKITNQIAAIESEIAETDYQVKVFDRSALAAFAPSKSTKGVFMGYDFHMTEDGPKLIEINSNAGGAFIVNAIGKAVGQPYDETEQAIAEMFIREWTLFGGEGQPSTLAIVDENPEDQYHYPDMLLAANMLERRGIEVLILDPSQLSYRRSGLYSGETKIDMIYNRLTDFELTADHLSDLKQAWLDEAVAVTPDPRHHGFHADKRNLVYLSERLPFIPETIEVTLKNADTLWANRKNYYFKPYGGYGSRAVYRGAKLTKSKWQDISRGGYVAQKFIKPPLRLLHDGEDELKFDIRVYTYNGQPLLMAARIYQGQVTNLRTEGGGLAPVIALNAPVSNCLR